MKEISKERAGEIALAILKDKARNDRVPDVNDLKRSLGNASKTLEIPPEELLSFWIKIYGEIFSEVLSKAEEVTFGKEVPKQPSPLKVIGDKIKGFIGFKK
jgi:hypothetical protein